jgi:hypothetical protein
MALKDLTQKQRLFVEYYLIDLNATEACRKAGYSASSEHVLGTMGAQNMENPDILEAIDKAMARRMRRINLDQDRILEEVAYIALDDTAAAYKDRVRCLELAGRHMGMFPTKVDATLKAVVGSSQITKEELAAAVQTVADKF